MGFERKKIIVVGAGPAGMMAAIRAAQLKQDVILLEKNSTPGKKLLLSGKGRCNLTNLCELDAFLGRFSKNGQFLRDAFKKFFNRELMDFFEKRSVKLKVERQQRVFPLKDKAESILEVLQNELRKNRVKVVLDTEAKDILLKDKTVRAVLLPERKFIPADKIILATGGASYSFTGSDGQGLELARRLGHAIIDLSPGLVPLETGQKYVKELSGLTLKNIRFKISNGQSQINSEVGELLFTGFGVSGPLIFSLSAQVAEWLSRDRPVFIEIDLKPGLSGEQCDARLLREFKLSPKKNVRNVFKSLLPLRLVDIFLGLSNIPPDKKVSQISARERSELVSLLKGLRLDIIKSRPLEEAMVTRGGVSLKEIDPRTMESRKISGLYFAGEMIDVDADTGGFNLQAAFSTGYLAGESASQ